MQTRFCRTSFSLRSICSVLVLLIAFPIQLLQAQTPQRLKDFRGTGQKVALIRVLTEFVDQATEDRILTQMRKAINRYTRTFSDSAVSEFKTPQNPQNKYFKPVESKLEDAQKQFLMTTTKDNNFDIVVLGSIRESVEGVEVQFQLFDSRIESLSGIEKGEFSLAKSQANLDLLAYKLLNYLDRDGYVHSDAQDFLEAPLSLAGKPELLINRVRMNWPLILPISERDI